VSQSLGIDIQEVHMRSRTLRATVLATALAAIGATAQAQYAPRHDLDRDGIANRYDRDRDGDGIRNRNDRDRDGDGIRNRDDPNPNIPNRTRVSRMGPYGDMDRDGIQNRRDRDRDGDGIRNHRDRYPDDRRYM
jgi:hypothetical protein